MFSGGHQERYPRFASPSSQRYSGHFETPQARRSAELKHNPMIAGSIDPAQITRPPMSLASTDVGIPAPRTSHASPIEHLDLVKAPLPTEPEPVRVSRPPLTTERSKRFSATRSITRSLSPIKRQSSSVPTLTGDIASEATSRNRTSGIAAWFQGSSEPMTLGISFSDDATEPPEDATRSVELDNMSNNQPSTAPDESPSPTRRYSWFSVKTSPMRQVPPPEDTRSDVDATLLAILDVFDANAIQPVDPPSTKRLRDGIEQHLLKLNASHRSEVASLQAKIKDYEILQDERNEAETRADLLKAQLEAMAALVAEKEQTSKDLMDQLTLEREQRAKEEEARRRSIMLVSKQSTMGELEPSASPDAKASFHFRPGSATSEWDQGYYSDASSPREGGGSPRISAPSLSPASSRSASPERHRRPPTGLSDTFDQPGHDHPVSTSEPARPPLIPRLSTFQKVLLGMSMDDSSDLAADLRGSESSPASAGMKEPLKMSSSSVKSLRAENQQLQDRIAELERTVESCLSVIGV